MNKFLIALIAVTVFISCEEGKGSDKKEKKNKEKSDTLSNGKADKKNLEDYTDQEWLLPNELREISGIAFVNNTQLACVQDEHGILFIYDLEKQDIVKRISFAGKGDFEAVAIVANTAYVLRSDGVIIEIKDITAEEPSIAIFPTELKKIQDTEGLCYDKNNNRLLISCKGADRDFGNKRPIYAFDLKNMQLISEPILLVDLDRDLFKQKGKKIEDFQPTDIAIHPKTNHFYFTDAPQNKLFIVNKDGNTVFKKLSKTVLEQPEGMAFNENGELFIASEGVEAEGKIIKLNNKFFDKE